MKVLRFRITVMRCRITGLASPPGSWVDAPCGNDHRSGTQTEPAHQRISSTELLLAHAERHE
jgi:hypothetical protein